MSYNKKIEFTAAVRGYHFYRRFWKPTPFQKLNCFFEDGNPFDPFAIKVCEIGKTIAVGHLPREISRATKFFIDRGGHLSVTLTSEHYRRSPLVQGGMEIACKVTASIPGTCINLLILQKYQDIVEENYTVPKEEAILVSYLVPNDDKDTDQERRVPMNRNKKRNTVQANQTEPKCKDIRIFFSSNPRQRVGKQKDRTEQHKSKETVVINID